MTTSELKVRQWMRDVDGRREIEFESIESLAKRARPQSKESRTVEETGGGIKSVENSNR
jgi:hypothetical protein